MVERPASGCDCGGLPDRAAAVTDETVSAWFVREVMPFEANLMHYLQRNWRNTSELPDLRQEVYVRVLDAARQSIPDNPSHFVLVCARNLLIDQARRRNVVPMESFADIESVATPAHEQDADRALIEREELRRVEAALEHLPARTREAVSLAYFEGLRGKEIARRMGVSKAAASQLLAKGALALGRILYSSAPDRAGRS